MREILLGIALIIIVGFGGLVYRNIVEHPYQPIACPMDARVCPDGTAVGRTGTSCTFPACPAPNVSLADLGIEFAVPAGFVAGTVDSTNAAQVALYESVATSSLARIMVSRFPIAASSTALATIRQTAISLPADQPVAATALTSTMIGTHRFTVAQVERFEGSIQTAYYLARQGDVLRFDALDTSVSGWMDPSLSVATLPAHTALAKLLSSLQGQ